MPTKPSVLVVEDEEAIRVGICDVLAFHGIQPTGVSDGDAGLAEALTGRFDLVVLDVMLPGIDGFTICRTVREKVPSQAILMLTAKGAESDILQGFKCGADDYVPKPFSVAQLVARVQALLRRATRDPGRRFKIGRIEVDSGALRAERGEQTVDLTPRDIQLLAFLAQDPGRVSSRDELLREVWGYQRVEGVETRCVDMHIAKLRRKLEPVVGAGGDALIETVRGAGYRVRAS
jgi:two-component system response regulator RegX3